jgi:hypothetical protein
LQYLIEHEWTIDSLLRGADGHDITNAEWRRDFLSGAGASDHSQGLWR